MEQRNNIELQKVQEESIRLMQKNVLSTEELMNLPYEQFRAYQKETTETRLMGVRESMTFTRAKKTIRRTGWYFTERYAPCGSEVGA